MFTLFYFILKQIGLSSTLYTEDMVNVPFSLIL